jgi:hypothetical protein
MERDGPAAVVGDGIGQQQGLDFSLGEGPGMDLLKQAKEGFEQFRRIRHSAGDVGNQAERLLQLRQHGLRCLRCRTQCVGWIRHDHSSLV